MKDNITLLRDQVADLSPSDLKQMLAEEQEKVKVLREQYRQIKEEYQATADRAVFLKNLLRARNNLSVGPRVLYTETQGKNAGRGIFVDDTIVTACQKILKQYKEPLEVSIIVLHMKSGDFPFRTSNPERSVEVVLQREDAIFEKVKPHVFKLAVSEDEEHEKNI